MFPSRYSVHRVDAQVYKSNNEVGTSYFEYEYLLSFIHTTQCLASMFDYYVDYEHNADQLPYPNYP